MVVLDGWLEISLDPRVFDCVWVVKGEMETILAKFCSGPGILSDFSAVEKDILDTIRQMCHFDQIDVITKVQPTPSSASNGV